MSIRPTHRRLSIAVVMMTVVAGLSIGPMNVAASRPTGHTSVAPSRPRTDVIRVLNGEVADHELVGNRIVMAGTFTQVKDVDGVTYTRKYLAAYDQTTGRLDLAFDPVIDKPVADITSLPDGSAIFIGGEFSLIDGVSKKKVARLTPAGDLVAGFKANTDARVGNVVATPSKLYIGGRFTLVNGVSRLGLAAVNPVTGAVDSAFNFPLTEGKGLPIGAAYTIGLDTSADHSTLMVAHTANKVQGQVRLGMALVDISGATPSLKNWRTRIYEGIIGKYGYMFPTGAAFAADGSYAVIVNSGGDAPPTNDTAIKLPTNVTGDDIQPSWVTRSFDSLYAVAITDQAVYIGGHLAFTEAPGSIEPWPGDTNINYSYGPDERGPAQLGNQVVRRGHLAALNIATGKALAWDPGSDAYHGVVSLVAIPNGLLMGHDGNRVGGFTTIGRHAFFDFRKVPPAENPDSTIDEPFNGSLIPGGTTVAVIGRATATAGVKRVLIEVINKAGQYLQANNTFATTYASRDATLATPLATSTTWSTTLPAMPPTSYVIWSRAINPAAVKEPTKTPANIVVRPVDATAPVWTYLNPPSGTVSANSTITMEGQLTDNDAVASVKVSFYNTATEQYLQSDGTTGANFYEFSMFLDAPDTPSTKASLTVSLPDGYWYTTATARDRSGSIARQYYGYTIAKNDFLPPTLTVTSPSIANQEYGADQSITLSGTASDDVGLNRGMLHLTRPYDDKGINAAGTFGTAGYYYFNYSPKGAKSLNWSTTIGPLPAGSYTGYVYSYDLAGRVNYQYISIVVKTPGDAFPTVALQTPYKWNSNPNSLTFDVGGIANDDLGVVKLKVRIRQATAPYLHLQTNGTWAAPVATVDFPVASPGATSTTWTVPVSVPTPASYYVWVFPEDTAGQFPLYSSDTYGLYDVFPGDADPVATLTSPEYGATVVGGVANITGTATDDKGVVATRSYIYNTATGEGIRLDGTYGTSPNWVFLNSASPNATSTAFSYTTVQLPPGTYGMYVTAIDTVDQWDLRYVWSTFTVPA